MRCEFNFTARILHNTLYSSAAQLGPTLCNPMDYSTPAFPVHHQLLEFAQTQVHQVSDAIQSSHLLPSPSPPAFNLSQHQGFFQRVSSLHQIAKVLELQLKSSVLPMNIQDQSPLEMTGWSYSCPRDSQESSPTPQFKSINSLALSFLYGPTLTYDIKSWVHDICLLHFKLYYN